MSKNLLKIGAILFVAAVIVVLLFYGNQNLPPIIEEGKLKFAVDDKTKLEAFTLYNQSNKISSFGTWEMGIRYNGTTKRAFSNTLNDSWFGKDDNKEIKINGNEMVVSYSNSGKDPNRIDLIFKLENDTLKVKILPNVSETEKLERTYCSVYFDRSYGKIVMPSGESINNEGEEYYTWELSGGEIPERKYNNYSLIISNSTMLNITGNFDKILTPLKAQRSQFWFNPNESLNIKVQGPINYTLYENKENLRFVPSANVESFTLYNKTQKISSFGTWEMWIRYNGTTKRAFSNTLNDSWFMGNDNKEIKINGNEMVVSYSNSGKDPNRIDLIFKLENDTLKVKILPNVSETEKLERTYCSVYFDRSYGKIVMPSGESINNEGEEYYTWELSGGEIPERKYNNYSLIISNTTMLNISGNFDKILTPLKAQISQFWFNPNESLNIKVQGPINYTLYENKENLRFVPSSSMESFVLYNKTQKISSFGTWEMGIRYNGTTKRAFSNTLNDSWFGKDDNKEVKINGNEMAVSYSNSGKDPNRIDLIFKLENDTLKVKIIPNVSETEKLERTYCSVYFDRSYGKIVMPSGESINNEGEEYYTWELSGGEIPERKYNNYSLIISNTTMLNISGNFDKILTPLKAQRSQFWFNPNESLNIKVQGPINYTLYENKENLRFVPSANMESFTLYNKTQKISSFGTWEMGIRYNGTTKRAFSNTLNDSWFGKDDNKEVKINGNEMVVSYSNSGKDPNRIDLIFKLENDTLKVKILPNVSETEKLESIYCSVYFDKSYERIVTPSDDLIKNDGNETYTWSGSTQIPKVEKNYSLIISNTTMLNISGNFSKIITPLKAQRSQFWFNPNETLTIKVQEPIELNLTQKYPLTISTSSAISDGIRIYKNGTQILSLSTWEAIFKHDGRTQRLLSSLKYDEDYPNKLLFNYNNSAKITKISEIKQNNKTTGYEMNVSWLNESRDVQEIGFSIKIYENKSYAEIKYFYRTKNAYVNLEPLSYGISFDKNKFTYIKVVKNSEITGNIKRNPVENEKKGYLNFVGCEQGKCDKIIADQWFIDKGDKNYEKAVEIKGNFSRIEHLFTYNLVRFYMDDFKEPLKIYVD